MEVKVYANRDYSFICSINGFSNFSMDEKRGRSIAWVPMERRELRVKLDQIFFRLG